MSGQQVWGENGIIINELELTALKVMSGCWPDRKPLEYGRMRRRVVCDDARNRNGRHIEYTDGARVYGPPWAIEILYRWRRERRPETDQQLIDIHRMMKRIEELEQE